MPVFTYKAIQRDGTIAEGEIEAGGRGDAFQKMEGRGLRPIRLNERNGNGNGHAARGPGKSPVKPAAREKAAEPAKLADSSSKAAAAKNVAAPAPARSAFGGRGKITPRVLENFTRLLSSLLAAGVPLSRALVILVKEAANPLAREKWKEVHDLVVDGLSLADAMARSPQTFPRVYVAMVEAGETGGFLDVVLEQIADFQSRERDLRSKVVAAMTYPVILLVLALGVLSALLVFFIPNIMPTFASMGGKLPVLTQLIIALSDFLRSYGLFLLVGTGIAGFLTWNWFTSEKGRRTWESFILRAPVVGPLVALFAMARFCRMLGTLLGAGVPLINCLNVARRSIGNQILVDAVSSSIEQVKEGKALGPSLGQCPVLFTGATLEMISVAEESGKLDKELVRLADVTESDLDRGLKSAVALAEPLMLFFIAGFIGVIFIGMVLPIFTLQDHIK